MNRKALPVAMRLHDCDAGWIFMDITVGDQTANIRCSQVFDPFPDIIRWMEAIITDVQKCSFEFDEEGSDKRFIAIRHWNELVVLIVDNVLDKYMFKQDAEEYVHAVVSKRQLIDTLYNGIHEFARSPEYKPLQWTTETLGERLLKVSPDMTENVLTEILLLKSRAELRELFYKVAPMDMVTWPDIKDGQDKWKRSVNYAVQPESAPASEGMVLEPILFNLPEDYDQWPEDRKREELSECLAENVGNHEGCRLEQLKSESIEKYLESAEQ